MSELIGKVVSNKITDNGISLRIANMVNGTGIGVDAINETYRHLCGQSGCGTDLFSSHYPSVASNKIITGDINSFYPSYSFNLFDDDFSKMPVYKYTPVTKNVPIPNIYDVKVYNDKVVKVFFNDGTTETAVCQEGDKFDLDMGITVCIMKKMLGRNEYFRMLKKAKKNAAAHRELEKKSAEAVEIRKRQRAKEEARKKARRERKNKELATAIAEAMTAKKKK